MQRRTLLSSAATALLGLGRSTWAAVDENAQAAGPRLVVIFMRGAVDGLSIVVPHAEPAYYAARPTIAIGKPGSAGGTLDLDGRFGLHPALASLLPLWQAKHLAFVQACGSPDPTRSHFDAQDYMESATPGRKSTQDGWMNRLLGAWELPVGETAAPSRAISIGATLPRILTGTQVVANLPSGAAASKPTVLDRPAVSQAFARMYGGDDELSKAYQSSQQTHREVMRSLQDGSLNDEMLKANNGAPLPNGFPDDAARLAQLMRRDHRVQLGFMAVGGWDTHANQGAGQGQLATRLGQLGQGLTAMAQQLGPVFEQTTIVVMSEFGRTVKQNGNGGTDHGHGNVMWLLGGPVAGGVVAGQWPGLGLASLYEGRDLAVTTDFRQVLADVMAQHLRLSPRQIAQVLPQFLPNNAAPLGLLRA